MVYSSYFMESPVIQNMLIAAAGVLTLFLPGTAVLVWMPRTDLDFPQKAARALGISMALTALLGLLTFLTGLRFSSIGMFAVYSGFLLFGLAGWLRQNKPLRISLRQWKIIGLTLAVEGAVVAWRFYQARGLVLPAWVDSVDHVLIVQAVLARGGVPASLAPYVPVPFYYHFGFHVLAAAFTFWSRLPVDQAVLVFGQILMAMTSLAVYRLACVLWKSSTPGGAVSRAAAAALLVAFVSHMPGYYLTWGRYTLLTGLTLAALAIAEVIEVTQSNSTIEDSAIGRKISNNLHEIWPIALMVAGVLLTHYLVAIILALFLVLYGIRNLWRDILKRQISYDYWIPLIGGVLSGMLLALPWLVWVVSFAFSSFNVSALLPERPDLQGYASYLWSLAGPIQNYALLATGLSGLALAMLKPSTRVFALWSLLLGLLCLPVGIQLGPMRPDIVVMMIFLPAVVLAGHLIVSIGDLVSRLSLRRWTGLATPSLALVLFCIWGIQHTSNIINPVTVLVNQADRQALEWVSQNTPLDARFYINTAPWQGPIYRGVDGGWWILSLTGRQMLLPPVAYAWGQPSYVRQLDDWASQASEITTCTPAFWELVQASGVNYIYLHSGVGAMQPQGLTGCSGIEQVYALGGVEIYKINRP